MKIAEYFNNQGRVKQAIFICNNPIKEDSGRQASNYYVLEYICKVSINDLTVKLGILSTLDNSTKKTCHKDHLDCTLSFLMRDIGIIDVVAQEYIPSEVKKNPSNLTSSKEKEETMLELLSLQLNV
uniref:Uncharacterized protein n=1 Tax=Glossina austeni TaxID=7395 RepID=A0A1A9UYK8_GLOAU